MHTYEPRSEKTGLRGFRPDCTIIEDGKRLVISDLGIRGIVRTIHVAKTKTLISFAVTAKLICVFVFAHTKSRFSHNEAHKYNV